MSTHDLSSRDEDGGPVLGFIFAVLALLLMLLA
jgi:hypothetical protein